MGQLSTAQILQDTLEETLELLKDYAWDQPPPDDQIRPLPSLLEQCEQLCQELPGEEPVRSIHHFACTGGTLLCKCLAVMPNVTLLSEIDPLSGLMLGKNRPNLFLPTDLIYGARVARRPVDDAIVERIFVASVAELRRALSEQGRYLILRDHAHSHFCTEADPNQRKSVRELLAQAGPVRSVVSVRHPLDSYLSLLTNKWTHFSPFGLEEYAQRYRSFLVRHEHLSIFRYEDFVDNPDGVLNDICAELALPFVPDSESMLGIVSMSGDSGRSSSRIGLRDRRDMPDDVVAQIPQSPTYVELCKQLGYSASP